MGISFDRAGLWLGFVVAATSTPASAFVYATSRLEIQNLVVSIAPQSSVNYVSFTSSVSNSATLTGLGSTSGAACAGAPGAPTGVPGSPGSTNDCSASMPRLDAGAANAPGSTVQRAPVDLHFFGPAGGQTFANAESVVDQSQLTGDAATTIRAIAETELQTGTIASATAQIAANSVIFTLGSVGTIDLSFTANPDLYVEIADPDGLTATASISARFVLDDLSTGLSVLTWTPHGTTSGNDCISVPAVSCNETFDSEDLNTTVTTTINNTSAMYSHADTIYALFGLSIGALPPGTYMFTLMDPESARVTRSAVPEPATIGLLFAGLVATTVARRGRHAGSVHR